MKLFSNLIFCYPLVFPLFISAQSNHEEDWVTIKGKVVDENGEGIPGMSIAFWSGCKGTITNNEGYFEVTLPKYYELRISYPNTPSIYMKVADLESTNYQVELDISTMVNLINDEVVGYVYPKAPFRKRLWWKIKSIFTKRY